MENDKKLKKLAERLGSHSRTLKISKNKDASKINLLSDDDVKQFVNKAKSDNYFHKYFKTRIALTHGDVFMVDFNFECGSELRGPHFVAVLLDSKENDPMVTVVPLKSYKGILNPRSDILLGKVEGTTTGNQSIALINQIKSIDKSRMIEHVSEQTLKKLWEDEKIAEDDEIKIKIKTVYRLTEEQFNILLKALIELLRFGYIRH